MRVSLAALVMSGLTTKLGGESRKWDEMYAWSSESTLTEWRLASWKWMRKREMRIAVRLWDDDVRGDVVSIEKLYERQVQRRTA